MGSKFWFLPLSWAMYVMSISAINVANITENKPLMDLGFLISKKFIIFLFLFTIALELLSIYLEKILS